MTIDLQPLKKQLRKISAQNSSNKKLIKEIMIAFDELDKIEDANSEMKKNLFKLANNI
jgi:chaperonin cofactor prefoldin